MKIRSTVFLAALFVLVSCTGALNSQAAQDATVVEPFFPPLCSTVDAQLQSDGGRLAAADEQKLDTARIQKAIDRCGRGRAVKLRVDEEKNAFLTGPLVLKPEVALILDRGVTLFASRDAALYASAPGSCGAVNQVAAGCKPLIAADHANDTAIMGDGIIDGRGGEKVLGAPYSWWELAGQTGGQQRVPQLIGVQNSDNFTLYRVTLRNAPAENLVFDHGDGLTVWGAHIESAHSGAGNNGIVPGPDAKHVTITQSTVGARNDQ